MFCFLDYGSQLSLHTINGRLVGTVESVVQIYSLAISSAAEGISINCVAAGLQNGVIRYLFKWLKKLFVEVICGPIVVAGCGIRGCCARYEIFFTAISSNRLLGRNYLLIYFLRRNFLL